MIKHHCDRCNAVSDMGDKDTLPEDWVNRDMPVRGSEGARSTDERVICATCDDELYAWFHDCAGAR